MIVRDADASEEALGYVHEIDKLGLINAASAIPPTDRRGEILQTAIKMFARTGFEAATMRDLADAVGLRAPAIYNHFSSKEQILEEAVRYVLSDFFAVVAAPLLADSPSHRLEGVVRRHALYQIERRDLALANDALINTGTIERVLPRARSRPLIGGLHHYFSLARALVCSHLDAACERDPAVIAFSILAICDRVSAWYRPDRPLTPQDVEDEIWGLASRMVVGRDPRGGPPRRPTETMRAKAVVAGKKE